MARDERPLVVAALGGNALLRAGERGTLEEQIANAAATCRHLMALVRRGCDLILTHGNGPQVGALVLQNDLAAPHVPHLPLEAWVGASQGLLGYVLQQALLNEFRREGLRRYVVTMITQVQVDPADPAFGKPTKPVGPFLDRARAEELARERGWTVMEDSGRGWRRVVPSPRPIKVLQRIMIRDLARAGHVVIAVGGGGIPIAKDAAGNYVGVEAVIDKDLATASLALEVRADRLVILTEVPCAYTGFRTPRQKALGRVAVDEMKALLQAGQFGTGSMAPKVEAALAFTRQSGKPSCITSAESLEEALQGRAGTHIVVPDQAAAREVSLFPEPPPLQPGAEPRDGTERAKRRKVSER